jgi:hypothetical protein
VLRLGDRLVRLAAFRRLDRMCDARMEQQIRARTGDCFRESNRKLAELTRLDLAKLGYAV